MKEEELQNASTEQLTGKKKSLKTLMVIFIPLILGLSYFIISDYVNKGEINWSILTIAICTLGGPAVIYPEFKQIEQELKKRS
jgi:hypothetical protein